MPEGLAQLAALGIRRLRIAVRDADGVRIRPWVNATATQPITSDTVCRVQAFRAELEADGTADRLRRMWAASDPESRALQRATLTAAAYERGDGFAELVLAVVDQGEVLAVADQGEVLALGLDAPALGGPRWLVRDERRAAEIAPHVDPTTVLTTADLADIIERIGATRAPGGRGGH